jgi:hypothetical protein
MKKIAIALLACVVPMTASAYWQQPTLTSRVFYSVDPTGEIVSTTKIGTLTGDVLNVTGEVRIVHSDAATKLAYNKVSDHAKNLLVTVAAGLP